MHYKGIIFDLDGTLLDTLRDLAVSMNQALIDLGYDQHPTDKYRMMVGDGARVLAERALPADQINDRNVQAVLKCFLTEYGRNWKNETRPYPGILECLEELESMELKLAVLSNKPDKFTKDCIAEFFPEVKFSAIIGEQPAISRKPSPEGALTIASQLKLSPDDFIYVGDTATDMETAVNAGMYPAGVAWGFRTKTELLQNGAKILFDHPDEIGSFICNCL